MPKLLYKNEKEKPESWGEVVPRGEKVWELVGRGKKEIAFDGSVRLKFLADRFRVPRLDSVFTHMIQSDQIRVWSISFLIFFIKLSSRAGKKKESAKVHFWYNILFPPDVHTQKTRHLQTFKSMTLEDSLISLLHRTSCLYEHQ